MRQARLQTAFLNSAVIASEMPWVGLTSKYKPGEAHFSMFLPISLENGAIQVLYQALVGSGR